MGRWAQPVALARRRNGINYSNLLYPVNVSPGRMSVSLAPSRITVPKRPTNVGSSHNIPIVPGPMALASETQKKTKFYLHFAFLVGEVPSMQYLVRIEASRTTNKNDMRCVDSAVTIGIE